MEAKCAAGEEAEGRSFQQKWVVGSGGNFAELETPLTKEHQQDMFRESPVFGF